VPILQAGRHRYVVRLRSYRVPGRIEGESHSTGSAAVNLMDLDFVTRLARYPESHISYQAPAFAVPPLSSVSLCLLKQQITRRRQAASLPTRPGAEREARGVCVWPRRRRLLLDCRPRTRRTHACHESYVASALPLGASRVEGREWSRCWGISRPCGVAGCFPRKTKLHATLNSSVSVAHPLGSSLYLPAICQKDICCLSTPPLKASINRGVLIAICARIAVQPSVLAHVMPAYGPSSVSLSQRFWFWFWF